MLQDKIKEIELIIQELETNYNYCNEKQSQLDKIIVDIEHEIEFDSVDGSTMLLRYKEFKSALRLRRMYKDKVAEYLSIRANINPNIIISANRQLDKIIIDRDSRGYRHRIKKELRKEILNNMEV